MSKKSIEKFFNFTNYVFSKKHLYTMPKIETENIENIDFSFLPKDSIYLELNKLIKYFQFIPIVKEERRLTGVCAIGSNLTPPHKNTLPCIFPILEYFFNASFPSNIE